MDKFVEAANALLKRISDAVEHGALFDRAETTSPLTIDIITDVKILCYEFGNPAITDLMGKTAPPLAQCQRALEKIRDTALFRTRQDS